MATGSAPGAVPVQVQKAVDRIKVVLAEGSFYEAQQMFKTLYHRHRARKQMREAYLVLQEGAALQMKNCQVTCGVELGLLLVEAYTKDGVTVKEGGVMDGLLQLIESFPRPVSASGGGSSSSSTAAAGGSSSKQDVIDPDASKIEECSRLVLAAVKWAKSQRAVSAACSLHDAYAEHLWQAYGWRRFGLATQHFVRGSNSALFAEALTSCSALAPAQEQDLFITRAVLQVLASASGTSLKRHQRHARNVLDAHCKLQPALDTPILHFLGFLLQALERRSLPLVLLLKEKYAPVLARDPTFGALLYKIEQLYLDAHASSGGLGGMLGGLLQNLTGSAGGGNEIEEIEEDGEEQEEETLEMGNTQQA